MGATTRKRQEQRTNATTTSTMSYVSKLSLARAVDENDDVHGWDETIDDRQKWQKSTFRASVASHAVAHKTIVCGTVTRVDEGWITWKTSFAPHQVCRVASNSNGSIIAATMDNGTVSILRGSNGVILATRRVAVEGVRLPAEISFVSDDTLLIVPPEDGSMILVSAIDGAKLNSNTQGVVSEAARSMTIHSVRFDALDDIRTIRGCYYGENDIRFGLVDGDGKLAIYDYDIGQKQSKLVQKHIHLGKDDKKNWEIDFDVGIRVQMAGKNKPYLVLVASFEGLTKIFWLDFGTLNTVSYYTISKDGIRSPRIISLELLSSCGGSVAVAVAFKFGTNSPKIETRVIQAAILTDESVGTPHDVFTIPVPASVKSLSIAPLEITARGLYSFRCKTWMGGEDHDCYIFKAANNYQDGPAVASIRLLATCERYDEAYSLVQTIGEKSLTSDAFARFHPAEIALRRLLQVISSGGIGSEQANKDSREHIRQLVVAAHSGNEYGQLAFLSAANEILEWPDENVMARNPPTLTELLMALKGFLSAMKSVSNCFKGRLRETHNAKVKLFQERIEAVEYLGGTILGGDKVVKLNAQFAGARSSMGLFTCLVQNRYFVTAEHMWKSSLRDKLTTDAMVAAVLGIKPTVDPREYASLLEEIVFPSLAINHELLPSLLGWSCDTADAFDDGDLDGGCYGLDEAIYLLEISEKATKNLRVRVHGSFAQYVPFAEKVGTKRRKVSPRNTSLDESTTSSFSFTSTTSRGETLSKEALDESMGRPNPTVLERSRMKGGAQLARHGQITSLRVDAVDESEEIVEAKLGSARCLKRARSLGLSHDLVRLRSFALTGGVQYVAKELLRLCSSSSLCHEERFKRLSTQGRKFCVESAADFDQAISEYAQELCGDKNTTKKAIEESASLARCCIASETRCRVTLLALRAALFCRFSPQWLTKLSLESIQWAAGDPALRSELEEASRLLLIDGIVGRYCGEGAKELFHVDNPRHAMRLLDFVSIQFQRETVLDDALDLCDAFAHLSREDACSRIIQNAILRGHEASSGDLLCTLYCKDAILAKSVFSRVLSFCIDVIDGSAGIQSNKHDSSIDQTNRQEEVVIATKCAQCLANIALSFHQSNACGPQGGFSSVYLDEEYLEGLIEGLQRLQTLQHDHGIFLSLSDLRDAKKLVGIATELMMPIALSYLHENATNSGPVATHVKRTCSLLAGYSEINEDDIWYATIGIAASKLAFQATGLECMHFLTDLGVFEASKHELVARSCLAVSLSLCAKVSRNTESCQVETSMKSILMASSVLYDHTLQRSPEHLLEPTLSLGELCDVISHVLVRSDEGVGEELCDFRKSLHFAKADNKELSDSDCSSKIDRGKKITAGLRLRQPTIHSSWYIGDGLLLPPTETLSRGLEFCMETVAKSSSSDAIFRLLGFVEARGAHALSLRLLITSASKQLCRPTILSSFAPLADASLKTLTSLAERYLGGTGNGITSAVIDSQLAVSFLLSLPLRTAFKTFRSTLPTAISTRDFKRVVTLAGIGKVAGSGELFKANGSNTANLDLWKKQGKFVAQCESLSLRAKWWDVLQTHNVRFDPGRFEDGTQWSSKKDEGKETPSSKYIVSLTPSFISNMSKTIHDTDEILKIASDFLVSFGLNADLAIQTYIKFLLLSRLNSSVSNVDFSMTQKNVERVGMKLSTVEAVVRRLIRCIHPAINRTRVLRDCLVSLEGSNRANDYEQISVVLALYHSELCNLLNGEPLTEGIDPKRLQAERELVDRRRDALAILSSYFQGRDENHRPLFSSFFLPMKHRESKKIRKKTSREILGLESSDQTGFDPLEPLHEVLQGPFSVAATSALAPLCLPLGVPRGYIHARSLIGRFRRSRAEGTALPSFEVDVLPVLNRLTSAADIADIASWSSMQYSFEDEDKLKSLDHSLNFAIRASDEAEKHGGKGRYDDNAPNALERVKNIKAAKDMLADRLAINAILRSVGITSETARAVSGVVKRLMVRLEEEVWSKTEFSPEHFVQVFLHESSLLAAEASLSSDMALSVGQFRELSLLVHRACQSVSNKYSHVQVGDLARSLVDKFLFYGDHESMDDKKMVAAVQPSPEVVKKNMAHPMPDIDEGDTMNFIMDLSSLREGGDGWPSELVVPSTATGQTSSKLTSEEESSSLKVRGSAREASEYASQRVSLRIAFVMAHADGYHVPGSREDDSLSNGKSSESAVLKISGVKGSKRQNKTLLGTLSSRGSKHRDDSVMAHSRELLKIVFAKTSMASLAEKDLNVSVDLSNRSKSRPLEGRTITFAMRHRALRTSSVLCPQDALEEVIEEEKLMDSSCSLRKCSFGVFVAKEIEEMGLPLPHSDLAQLSTMHFPSYARTLWRHHRNGRESKGRLLLLIMEMYLKEPVSDFGFVVSILGEILTLNLPRTLLLALEAICQYLERNAQATIGAFIEATGTDVTNAFERLSRMIISEIRKVCSISSTPEEEFVAGVQTLSRFGCLVQSFSCASGLQQNLLLFIEAVLDLISSNHSKTVDKSNASKILGHALKRVPKRDFDTRFKDKVSALVLEGKISKSVITDMATQRRDNSQEDTICNALRSFEESSLRKREEP